MMMTTLMACLAAVSLFTDFPGGNGRLVSADETNRVVRFACEPKGGSEWMWFDFEARGLTPGRWRFEGGKLTSVGPAVSEDGGRGWRFLTPSGDAPFQTFDYEVATNAAAPRFAFAMPYQLSDWNAFAASLRGKAGFVEKTLCRERSGRAVPFVEIGAGAGEWTLFFTARHHASEVSASPVFEGIVEEAVSDSEEARWLRAHGRVVGVPFVDLDGVENGDQGKGRPPHDHNRDYVEGLYPTVRAIRAFASENCASGSLYFVDLHAPWIRENEHDHFYGLGPEPLEHERMWRAYNRELEALTAKAALRYEPQWDIPFGRPWNDAKTFEADGTLLSSTRFFMRLPNCRAAFCMEYGYGLCGGLFTRAAARELGRNTFKAIVRTLRPDGGSAGRR